MSVNISCKSLEMYLSNSALFSTYPETTVNVYFNLSPTRAMVSYLNTTSLYGPFRMRTEYDSSESKSS